jgi:hypothetical protein
VGQQFRLLDFTAQTTLASSYGLLRISYITAIGAVKWEALNNAWNPSCLFDTKANWANGGGSLAPGTGYLANLFFNENVNPDLDPSNPAFSAPDDFANAFINAFNYHNHNRGPVWTKRCQYLCAAIHARAQRADLRDCRRRARRRRQRGTTVLVDEPTKELAMGGTAPEVQMVDLDQHEAVRHLGEAPRRAEDAAQRRLLPGPGSRRHPRNR